ncbi:hypothetical protein Tco_0599166 [Tanacetum coccineum]
MSRWCLEEVCKCCRGSASAVVGCASVLMGVASVGRVAASVVRGLLFQVLFQHHLIEGHLKMLVVLILPQQTTEEKGVENASKVNKKPRRGFANWFGPDKPIIAAESEANPSEIPSQASINLD